MSAIIGSTTSTLQTASFHLPNGTPSHWIHEPIVNDRADTSNPRLTDGNTSQDPNQRKRSSSLISLLTWNSFRRVFGPVKGNNKSGQKGKLICDHCRKIRSKVRTPIVKWLNCSVFIRPRKILVIFALHGISNASNYGVQRSDFLQLWRQCHQALALSMIQISQTKTWAAYAISSIGTIIREAIGGLNG